MKSLLVNSSKKDIDHTFKEYGSAIHNFFNSLEPLKPLFLTTGLFFLVYVPIIAIIPFLLYLQIHISCSARKKINFAISNENKKTKLIPIIILAICILIISIYNSTIIPDSDAGVYLNMFKNIEPLSFSESWDYIKNFRGGLEPLSFMLIKCISWFLALDEDSFFLVASLTFNTALFVFTYLFVPGFYPLIILINTMAKDYYAQVFLLRHIFSFIFVVPFIFSENIFICSILLVLGFLTHSTMVLVVPLFFLKILAQKFSAIQKIITSKYTKYVLLSLIVLFLFGLGYFGVDLIKSLVNYVQLLGIDTLSHRAEYYTRNIETTSKTGTGQTLMVINIFIWTFFLSRVNFKTAIKSYKNNPLFYNLVIFFVMHVLAFIFCFTIGFNFRIVQFLATLPGFFFLIPLISNQLEKKGIQYFLFLSQIGLFILVFMRNLFRQQARDLFIQPIVGGEQLFWNSEPLSASLFDYIEQFRNSLL